MKDNNNMDMNNKNFTKFNVMDAIMKGLLLGTQLECKIDLNNPGNEPPEEIICAFEAICVFVFNEKNEVQRMEDEIAELMNGQGFSKN